MHSRDESPGRERDRYNTAFSEQNEPVAGEQQCPHCTIGITMCQLLCAHKRITCIIKKKKNGMHLVPPNVLFFFFYMSVCTRIQEPPLKVTLQRGATLAALSLHPECVCVCACANYVHTLS